jgi:hypothetical protein
MKQMIQEQDALKMDKDEDRARQVRLSNLESSVISGTALTNLKPTKKIRVTSNENQVVVSSDEVRCGIFCRKLFYF